MLFMLFIVILRWLFSSNLPHGSYSALITRATAVSEILFIIRLFVDIKPTTQTIKIDDYPKGWYWPKLPILRAKASKAPEASCRVVDVAK